MTKKCPKCGNEHLGLLFTLYLKICVDCGYQIKWELDKGQKPLLAK